MVKLDRRTAEYILATGAAIDFLLEGKFTAPVARAIKATARRVLPAAGRAAARFIPRAIGTAGMIALRHPYIAAGAAIYVGVTEREKIRALLEQGYDIIEERLPTPSPPPSPGIPGVEEIITGGMAARQPFLPRPPRLTKRERDFSLGLRRARKPSSFNRAVSAGMKAIKKSTSYGGKGKIKPAKRAFSVVVKLASAKKKKKKAPKSGIRRLIWNAMKGLR